MKKSPPLALAPDPLVMDRRALLLAACAGCVAACSPPPPPNDAGDASPDAPADGNPPPPDGSADASDASVDAAPGCDLADVGALSEYPVGTRRVVAPMLDGRTVPLIVARDAMGLYALSARCRHFQGPVEPRTSGAREFLLCTQQPESSHGSTFDNDGNVLTGPALDPRYGNLANYRVTVCGDRVVVDPYTTVPAGTRTPVA